jgi:hypothetical protein
MMPHLKTKKLFAAIVTLLLMTITIPLVVAENTQQQSELISASGQNNSSEVPGVPDNAIQYNKTDVTPVDAKEQVSAGEPALFQYRNMTMLMNCSQNCEVIFNSDQEVTPKILGLTVEANQTMTLAMNMTKSLSQGETAVQKSLNFYLGIEPNSTLELQGQIRLYINQTELNAELNREVDTSKLTWMFWNQTQAQWQEVESYMDQNGYLVCNTDHFSTWTVAEIEQQADITPTPGSSTDGGISYTLIIAAVVVVAIIVLGIAVLVVKKR